MSPGEIVTVACHWCGTKDLAYLSQTPWLRYCPICGKNSYIVDGKVVVAETVARSKPA